MPGVSGNNLLFGLGRGNSSSPSPVKTTDTAKPKLASPAVENPLAFRESTFFGFGDSDNNNNNNAIGTENNNSNEAATADAHNHLFPLGEGMQGDVTFGNNENKRDDDEDETNDNDDEMSLNMEDDQLEIVKTTEDGAQYLELSMDFLEVNLNEEKQEKERRSSMTSNTGSVISTETAGSPRKERRRGGRRRNSNQGNTKAGDEPPPPQLKASVSSSVDSKTSETSKLEDNEACDKGKHRKKHRHKHRSKSEELHASFQVDDLEKAASDGGDRRSASASKLHDSKASMGSRGSKKRSKKDKKTKKSKKSKSKGEPQKSTSSEEFSSSAMVPEEHTPVQDLDDILNEAVEAELAVVDDLWMGANGKSKNPREPETIVPMGNGMTDVRAVKLAVSMPGDYENGLLGNTEVEAECERSLFEILDIDPWDREGSKYSDGAAVAAMERDGGACAKKYDFDAFGNELYPFSMLCAIGASLETVQKCYDMFPAAMDARDPTVGSPLHYACAYAGSAGLVEWLIEKNPKQLTEVDVLQRSPFHVACLYSARVAILKVLAAKSPKGLAQARDYDSNTTLHVAAEHDAPVDVIEFLAKQCPAALTVTRKDGATPLHLAVESGADVSKIKALVKASEDALKISDNKGQCPIHLSLVGPIVDAKTVKCLAKAYPPGLKAITNDGETPLAMAKRLNLEPSIKSLLES